MAMKRLLRGGGRPFKSARKWLQEWAGGLSLGDKIAPPDYGLQEFFYCFVNVYEKGL